MINPLVIVEEDGELHLVAGHRRLAAARMAGLAEVPCLVRKPETGKDEEVTFAENFFRKDLSPVELACAIRDCLTKKIMTVKELAIGFHRSEGWVATILEITNWPDDIQKAVHTEAISVGAARNLVLVTDKVYREFLVRNAVESGSTAKATAGWLQGWLAMQTPQEEITSEPVQTGRPQVPSVPQAPCLCCAQLFNVNEMSHVPVCGACIQLIRTAGMQQGASNQVQQRSQGPGQVY